MNKIERDIYTKDIIPCIEERLSTVKDTNEFLKLNEDYERILSSVAPYDFISYNKVLEFHEDKSKFCTGFYHNRQHHMGEIFESLNSMEMDDEFDKVIVTLPPRTGKTTIGVRFISWIYGRRHLGNNTPISSYAEVTRRGICNYVGEIISSEQHRKVFSQFPLGVEGSHTPHKYHYVDDLIGGALDLHPAKQARILSDYTNDDKLRRQKKVKEVQIASQWSIEDPAHKASQDHKDDPRCKIINIPALNEDGESNFDFVGGLTTQYYVDIKKIMSEHMYDALFMGLPTQ